jgi:hypothetical protein
MRENPPNAGAVHKRTSAVVSASRIVAKTAWIRGGVLGAYPINLYTAVIEPAATQNARTMHTSTSSRCKIGGDTLGITVTPVRLSSHPRRHREP